jgi:hypothetical protein
MKLALLVFAASLAVSRAASSAQSSLEKPAVKQPAAPQQTPPDPFAGAPAAKPDDVKSVESILAALYDVISGPPGERDWNRFRSLFMPHARLTSAEKSPDGAVRVRPNSVEDYVRLGGGYFLKNGFFEKPIVSRKPATSQVSAAMNPATLPRPARGINSFQMAFDGKRWWVVNILWDEERPDNPLPKEFASKP